MHDHAAYMREYRRTHSEYRDYQRKYHREWKNQHPNYYRDYNQKRRADPAFREKDRESWRKWRQNNLDKIREVRRQNPEKRKAQLHGRYIKLDDKCARCGATDNLERHHPYYSKPNLVITLCRRCHSQEHRKIVSPHSLPVVIVSNSGDLICTHIAI